MSNTREERPEDGRLGNKAWALIYVAAMIGAGAIYGSGLVSGPYAYLIMFAPFALVPFMTRAQNSSMARRGASSPALSRANWRIMASVLLMNLAIVATVQMGWTDTQDPGWALLLSMLVATPAIGFVWSMASYFREEEDEFLRHRAIRSALFALGFVLVCAAMHGALQLFGLVRPANSLWVLVAYAFGIGFSNLWHWMSAK